MRIMTGPLCIFFAFTSTLPIQSRSARIKKSLHFLEFTLRTLASKCSVGCVSTRLNWHLLPLFSWSATVDFIVVTQSVEGKSTWSHFR